LLGALEIGAERGKTAEKYLEDMKEGVQVSPTEIKKYLFCRGISVLRPLVRMEMTLVKSLHNLILFHIGFKVMLIFKFIS
jgi:hypothetical protein